jgi:hypothetical protein
MKFLIQKINKEIRHDFAFTLIDMIRFKNWLAGSTDIKISFIDYDTECTLEPDGIYAIPFKEHHKEYTPIGSVEFVTEFLQHFYGLTPKPLNVPHELNYYTYTLRKIWKCDIGGFSCLKNGKYFIKSATGIKKYSGIVTKTNDYFEPNIPIDDYVVSELITIESEWRVFVYENRLVGLQNYSGDFTLFPDVESIKNIIKAYKSAPIAYTLDVGIGAHSYDTFIIEVHNFFSCGLYGFNQPILVNMFYKWFKEYITKNSK